MKTFHFFHHHRILQDQCYRYYSSTGTGSTGTGTGTRVRDGNICTVPYCTVQLYSILSIASTMDAGTSTSTSVRYRYRHSSQSVVYGPTAVLYSTVIPVRYEHGKGGQRSAYLLDYRHTEAPRRPLSYARTRWGASPLLLLSRWSRGSMPNAPSRAAKYP